MNIEVIFSTLFEVLRFYATGDGNLHLNITSPEYDPELMTRIEPYVFDWVAERRGSVSAEHGLGFKKRDYIGHSKSAPAVEWMQNLKRLFDPNGILNPYKVLPSSAPLSTAN